MDEKEKKSIKITKVVVVKGDEFNQNAHAIVKEAMTNKIKRKMLIGTMEEILSTQQRNKNNLIINNKNLMPVYN